MHALSALVSFVTDLPVFRSAGFPDAVYLGVIANSARTEWVLRYLDYLLALSDVL